MTENPYINIVEQPPIRGRVTPVWWITSKSSGDLLGVIKWFGRWRCFCLFPEGNTIWNTGCLETINEFIGEQMAARRG